MVRPPLRRKFGLLALTLESYTTIAPHVRRELASVPVRGGVPFLDFTSQDTLNLSPSEVIE
jgi:hypothetical protein